MSYRTKLNGVCVAVVLAGGSYLARDAAAAPRLACSEYEWQKAAMKANIACGGPSSFYGYCDSNGRFVIEGIYCNNT